MIWNGQAPPTFKLHDAYNLADNRRVFIWESESAAGLTFRDRFNHIGKQETTPASDRTGGWQHTFAPNLGGFEAELRARATQPHAAIDLRRRGGQARGP